VSMDRSVYFDKRGCLNCRGCKLGLQVMCFVDEFEEDDVVECTWSVCQCGEWVFQVLDR